MLSPTPCRYWAVWTTASSRGPRIVACVHHVLLDCIMLWKLQLYHEFRLLHHNSTVYSVSGSSKATPSIDNMLLCRFSDVDYSAAQVAEERPNPFGNTPLSTRCSDRSTRGTCLRVEATIAGPLDDSTVGPGGTWASADGSPRSSEAVSRLITSGGVQHRHLNNMGGRG